jgi:hypothetical protein
LYKWLSQKEKIGAELQPTKGEPLSSAAKAGELTGRTPPPMAARWKVISYSFPDNGVLIINGMEYFVV